MDQLVQKFCVEEFGEIVNSLEGDMLTSLIKPMMVIIHSHRYNKKESFIEGLDFTIIRNLIYSYSKEARVRFMED